MPTEYPKPKRGQKVDCLGCNKGKVLGPKGLKDCGACKGKGYIIAK